LVPLRLQLRNFMSYGLEGGDLDLRPIHMACLSGGNGNGKSALVDAITWSLWGRSRAAREDDLLRHGTSEMEVEFEFASNHCVYRVIRKRSVRKGGGAASLELAIRDGETYRAITGNSIADTERAIREILRLSYETFINSSLLLQGRADLFTIKRPAERKEILGEILGLGQYEALAEQAREREREHRSEAEHLRARVEELDRFLAAVPGLEQALTTTEQELTALQTKRASGEQRVEGLERRVHTLLGLRDSLDRLGQRLATIAEEEAEAQRQRQIATDRIAAAQTLLADEQGIRERLEQLNCLRLENDRMAALVNKLRGLEACTAEPKLQISNEQMRISTELKTQESSLAQACAAAKGLRDVESELVPLRQRHGVLAALQAERMTATERLNEIVERLGGLRASIAGQAAKRKELRERILSLKSAGAICPTCGTPLDEHRRAETLDAAMQEGIASKALMEREQVVEATLTVEQQNVQAALATIERSLADAQAAVARRR
jgi:exonuclease SbcC